MIGSIIGAGIGAIGSIFGGIKASQAMRKVKDNINAGGLRAKIGALLLKPALRKLKHTMDVNEKGGAVFLGANKVVVKIHGSSKARSVTVGLLQAANLARRDITGAIRDALSDYEVENA